MTAGLHPGLALDAMLSELEALVGCESPTSDLAATARCADLLTEIAERHLDGSPDRVVVDGHTHLRWSWGTPRVVIVGHFDTVWPMGTLARWPFSISDDVITGPGVFDMKAGIIQTFHALKALPSLEGVAIVMTSDEETGSTSSQDFIEQTARGARAALILEPSPAGTIKIARKGVGMFLIDIVGRAAHAGLEPEKGVNTTVEAAHQILAINQLGRPEIGTTVTPSLLTSGTTSNTVPASARLCVDVRASSIAEMDRVKAALAALAPVLPGASITSTPVSVRPPFEPVMSDGLFQRALAITERLGLPALEGITVGGGSDGNLTAAIGTPTLDGLGAVGGNAHAEGEWMSLSAWPARTVLLTELVKELVEDK